MSAACSSCGAPIEWAVSERGKRMRVDADPVTEGNILLSHRRVGEPPVALYQSPEEIEQLRAQHERSPQEGPLLLFLSHFATCPNARAHRRKRTKATT